MNQEDLGKAIGKTRSLISHFERTGNINKYTLQEIADALNIDLNNLENESLEITNHQLEDPEKKSYSKDFCQRTIAKQKEEISFLKETINHQWQLLQELVKKNRSNK